MNRNLQNIYNSQIKRDTNDHIYYNVIIPHDPTQGNGPTLAAFKEQRVDSIVENPSDFYLSIIRFTVPGFSIPIFIFPIQSGILQSDLNLSNLSVTISFNNVDSPQTFLEWEPRRIGGIIPKSPSQNPPTYTQDLNPNSGYYYVYEYQHMIDIINTALYNAFINIPVSLPVGSEAPYFIYDPISQLISLISQRQFYDVNLPIASSFRVFLNAQLFTFLQAIPVYSYGADQPLGKDFQYIIKNDGNNFYNPPYKGCTGPAGSTGPYQTDGPSGPSGPIGPAELLPVGILSQYGCSGCKCPGYYKMTQEFNILSYWNSFRDLVFVSGTIPIINEYIPAQRLNSVNPTSPGENNFRPILTDFEPLLQYGGDARSILQYYPQGPYRFVDLQSNVPLRNFDVQIFWQDQFNNLFPVYISPRQEATIKFVFVKKPVPSGYE